VRFGINDVDVSLLVVTLEDLERKVHVADRGATVDGIYLRVLVHANEHMGSWLHTRA
jgi:hypothetical protein